MHAVSSWSAQVLITIRKRNVCSWCKVFRISSSFKLVSDKVPHQWLLNNVILCYLEQNLQLVENMVNRVQCVVINSYKSSFVPVLSGNHAGTIDVCYTSMTLEQGSLLFADCILYRPIKCHQDHRDLQPDLNKIAKCTDTRQMSLNINKCVTLRLHSCLPSTITKSYRTSKLPSFEFIWLDRGPKQKMHILVID